MYLPYVKEALRHLRMPGEIHKLWASSVGELKKNKPKEGQVNPMQGGDPMPEKYEEGVTKGTMGGDLSPTERQ